MLKVSHHSSSHLTQQQHYLQLIPILIIHIFISSSTAPYFSCTRTHKPATIQPQFHCIRMTTISQASSIDDAIHAIRPTFTATIVADSSNPIHHHHICKSEPNSSSISSVTASISDRLYPTPEATTRFEYNINPS